MARNSGHKGGGSFSSPGVAGSVSEFLGLGEITGRSKIILGFFVIIALAFFCRLFWVQIIEGPQNAAQIMAERTVDEDLAPKRGTIYDRNGNVLATSVEARKIVCDPSLIEDPEPASAQLAALMDADKDEIYEKLATKTTKEGVEIRYQILARAVDIEAAEVIEKLNIDGIFIMEDTKRVYPNGTSGAQVIGLTDIDGKGTTGLELWYDEVLGGEPGHIYYEVGANGNYVAGTYKRTDPVDGKDIVVSLDIEMQKVAEKKVKTAAKRMGGKSGQVLMLDGGTGEIIACCSTPYLDPVKRTGSGSASVITSAFEPGSIFKPVTMLAALETGTVDNKDKFFLPKKLRADEYYVSDAHERPAVTYTADTIMAKSSNVGLSLIGKKLGFETLYEKINQYHLNCELTNVDYPGEAAGYLTDVSTWTTIQSYNITFGQGVMVTPLQMTRFYGALVNDGVICQPHFLIKYPQTDETPTYKTQRITDDTKAIKKLNKMLIGVVKNGTGKSAAIKGYSVAGKTGTAEFVAEGSNTYAKDSYNLSFIGYMPESDSDLICYVGITHVPMDSVTTLVYHDIMEYAIERYNINQK